MGRNARRSGTFFNPLPWAVLAGFVLFAVLYLRHTICLTTDPDNPVNAYIRACYSDIAVNYSWRGWSEGVSPLGGDELAFPPLLAILIAVAIGLGGLLSPTPPDAPVHEYTGIQGFFGATAILLFAAFLLLIVCSVVLAKWQGRAWDAMIIAASPAVLAAGMVSWDLLALGLTALGMVCVAGRRTPEAGIVFGLAVATGTMPLVFVLGIVVGLLLRARWKTLGIFVLSWVATAVAIHLPVALRGFEPVFRFYHDEITKDISFGSIWFLLREAGVPFREFGAFPFVLTLLLWGCWVAWLYVTRRTPEVGTIIAGLLLTLVILAPAYPPQTGLWVLFALFLVRGADRVLWTYSVVLLLNYLAVWGWLGGHLSIEGNGPWLLYYVVVLVRLVLEAGMLFGVILDAASRDAEDEPVAERGAEEKLGNDEEAARAAAPA